MYRLLEALGSAISSGKACAYGPIQAWLLSEVPKYPVAPQKSCDLVATALMLGRTIVLFP